jgi:hypothetical protein
MHRFGNAVVRMQTLSQFPYVLYAEHAHRNVFVFIGEGPRGRRYGSTASMKLIVQLYDEDEDDDYFLSFS